MTALALQEIIPAPATLAALKRRVMANAAKRPGVYEFLDATGAVVYVGKAKNLRQRLLSYFAAPSRSKSSLLIRSAAGIRWRHVPSEFAALLEELRLIQSLLPRYNVHGSASPASLAFIKLAGGSVPRLAVTAQARDPGALYFGPFRGRAQTLGAVHVLADLLGLRDCADRTPMRFGDQASLFEAPLAALCIRHELKTCLGPCAAKVGADRYGRAVRAAQDFLEGRSAHPLDRVLDAMHEAAAAQQFERAAHWRGKLDELTRLFAAVSRLRAAVEALSFVYTVADQGGQRDDRVYLVRRGTVRAVAAVPSTPIEREAFAALVRRHTQDPEPAPVARTGHEMGQLMLVMSWFRAHPEEYERTSPFATWAAA